MEFSKKREGQGIKKKPCKLIAYRWLIFPLNKQDFTNKG
jgi:hypothetical protein